MKYPCLVNEKLCKTDIHLEIRPEGVDRRGEPSPPVIVDTKCNYQDSAKTVFTAEKKLIEITGTVLFPGDIAPELSVISGGTARICSVERRILRGTKARNPDGTVNYTKLEVI